MRTRAVFVALLLIFSLAPPVAAQDAQTLQAKHIAFAGFRFGDGRLPGFSVIEEVRGEKDGTLHYSRMIHHWGLLFRADGYDENTKLGWAFGATGKVFWYSDENGFTVPLAGLSAGLIAAEDDVFTDAVGTLPWKIIADDHEDGRDVAVVRVEPPALPPINLIVDKDSGAYDRAIIAPGSDYQEEIRFLNYAHIGAMRVVGDWQIADSDEVHRVAKISALSSVSALMLHPPPQTASWRFGGGSVPFTYAATGELTVRAVINGVEGRLAIATGANKILLTGAFARRAGIAAEGHWPGYGDPDGKSDTAHVSSIRIGGNELRNVAVYFGSRRFDGQAVDGELGFPLFAAARVSIDFLRKTVTLSDPSQARQSQPGEVRETIGLAGARPVVLGYIGRSNLMPMIVSTSSSADVLAWPPELDHYNVRSYDAPDHGACRKIDGVDLGNISVTGLYSCPTYGASVWLGSGTLEKLASAVFNYSRASMSLVPKAGTRR